MGIMNRFGPHLLFELGDSKSQADKILTMHMTGAEASKSFGWACFRRNYEDIRAKTFWALKHANNITKNLPINADGEYQKHKHLNIKTYAIKSKASGHSMFSRGFEGTNLRLVIASNSKRMIACYFGEYLNLSGLILQYRNGYPMTYLCERCSKKKSSHICNGCGSSYCSHCCRPCKECKQDFCLTCFKVPPDLAYSVHNWYFHRDAR